MFVYIIYIYIHMYACMNTPTHVSLFIHTYALFTCACIMICVYTYIHVDIYVRMYSKSTHVCIFIYIHTLIRISILILTGQYQSRSCISDLGFRDLVPQSKWTCSIGIWQRPAYFPFRRSIVLQSKTLPPFQDTNKYSPQLPYLRYPKSNPIETRRLLMEVVH